MYSLYPQAIFSSIYNNSVVKSFSLLVAATCITLLSFAGGTPELTWRNAALESGTAGADGAVYRFPQVDSKVDALVKIKGRSSSLVRLVTMDLTGSGWDKAWQPQVTYNNGTANAAADWYMEFEVTFVNKGTNVLTNVAAFDVTALDIDGNGDKIREYVSFYGLKSTLLETNTLLKTTSLFETVLGLLTNTGKRFDGPTVNYANIDTSGTAVMVTNTYENKNTFKVRTGGVASAANGAAERMYSLYFKGFDYKAGATSFLPVSLINWNAKLNTKEVGLSWTTTMETNSSHFVIERSTNGLDYSEIAMMFAAGDSYKNLNYAYTDKLNTTNQGVIYYRLKMVDKDGKSKVSDVRIVRTGKPVENMTIAAYPNPVVNELRVTVPTNWQDKKVTFQIFNGNGQVVKQITNNKAGQTEIVSVNELNAGIYVVRAISENETASQSIIKSK